MCQKFRQTPTHAHQ